MTVAAADELAMLYNPPMSDSYSPNRGGALVAPSLVVLCNTRSQSFATAKAWYLDRKSSQSVHYLVGRDGQILTVLPTEKVAWTSGRSEFGGRTGVNSFSVAIALVNVGPVMADGTAVSTGERLPERDIVAAKHRLPNCSIGFWQRYPDEQLYALERLIRQLRVQIPTLVEVVDLSMVAGFRGVLDCGPALPLARIQSALLQPMAADLSDSISPI
jgi:N-acetyl-anhydromuramyl-L-alanine amidase AmpD